MRKLALTIVAAVVAGPPVGLLLMQWVSVLRAVLFPETTCWIAAVDDHYLFSSEVPAVYMVLGFAWWLPAAVVAAGLAFFGLRHGSGRRFFVVVPIVAIVSLALLYFGTGAAVSLERDAYTEIRDRC